MTNQPPSGPQASVGGATASASAPVPETSGMAIASLVVGLVGFCIPVIGGLVGLVLGIVALRRIGRSAGTVGGRGVAIGGVVASALSLVFGLAVIGFVFVSYFMAQKWAAAAQDHAREAQVRTRLEMTAGALEMYRVDVGHYPTEAEGGLRALRQKPPGADRWNGPYLSDEPRDPWGRPLRYEPPDPSREDIAGHTYRLWSAGPDGADGTPDDVERR